MNDNKPPPLSKSTLLRLALISDVVFLGVFWVIKDSIGLSTGLFLFIAIGVIASTFAGLNLAINRQQNKNNEGQNNDE